MPTADFVVDPHVQEKYPEIITMLKGSESINSDEKKYWFDALKTMNDSQVEDLRSILSDEKKGLESIDSKEAEQKKQEEEKRVAEEKAEAERLKLLEERKLKEKESKKDDIEKQEELLSMLDDL